MIGRMHALNTALTRQRHTCSTIYGWAVRTTIMRTVPLLPNQTGEGLVAECQPTESVIGPWICHSSAGASTVVEDAMKTCRHAWTW